MWTVIVLFELNFRTYELHNTFCSPTIHFTQNNRRIFSYVLCLILYTSTLHISFFTAKNELIQTVSVSPAVEIWSSNREKNLCIRRVQPTRCNFSKFIYFCKTLYMFQTVFPSIIRSSKLHIQRQVFVRPLLLPAASLVRLAAGSSIGLTNT